MLCCILFLVWFLAAPQVNGGTVNYSYIMVNKDRPGENFVQLKENSAAFIDPNSNTD
jgi:hypothetical protein